MRKRLREPAYDARTAKVNPWKLITSGISEQSANYALFGAMCIKILSPVSAHAESTDFIS